MTPSRRAVITGGYRVDSSLPWTKPALALVHKFAFSRPTVTLSYLRGFRRIIQAAIRTDVRVTVRRMMPNRNSYLLWVERPEGWKIIPRRAGDDVTVAEAGPGVPRGRWV